MVDFTIQLISKNDVTVVEADPVANGLDGVNQGSGAHLDPSGGNFATITVNTTNYQAVNVTQAAGDTDFRDNDGDQELDGDVTIDGNDYFSGSQIEAEYEIIAVDDSTGIEYTILVVNIREAGESNSYGIVEGIAFIDQVPPTGVTLRILEGNEGPNYQQERLVPCFTKSTRIKTPNGWKPIDELKAGDLVETRDNGAKPICWIGQTRVPALGALAPIRIKKGLLGNDEDLVVSPNHRILARGWSVALNTGNDEALIAAKHLLGHDEVTQETGGFVTYYHMLFDAHELVWSNGCLSESFHPTTGYLDKVDAEIAHEIYTLFPELKEDQPLFGRIDIYHPRRFEVEVIAQAL